jgi:uracil-DNA glycosylase
MYSDWHSFIDAERQHTYFVALQAFLDEENSRFIVLPPQEKILAAFDVCPLEITKVVIVGQDPYHGQGQAHGLAFSVNSRTAIPPSLRNIFKEREADLGLSIPEHGDLTAWAQQGTLLLNSVLTVRAGEAHSHRNQGWETFTDHVISYLNTQKTSCVFVLWGSHAQQKIHLIDDQRHHIVTAPHPSPLSAHRGFLGSRPFSNINNYLTTTGQKSINWELPRDPQTM